MTNADRIIEMDSIVNEIIQRIAEAIEPEKIILFGSHANGDAREDSDIDLLIVYDGPETKREIKLKIRRLFPHPHFSMDLVVLSSDEFARQRNIPTTIGRIAAKEGTCCYG